MFNCKRSRHKDKQGIQARVLKKVRNWTCGGFLPTWFVCCKIWSTLLETDMLFCILCNIMKYISKIYSIILRSEHVYSYYNGTLTHLRIIENIHLFTRNCNISNILVLLIGHKPDDGEDHEPGENAGATVQCWYHHGISVKRYDNRST